MTYRGKFFIAILSALITFYAFSGFFAGPIVGWFETRAQQPINDPGAQIRIFESVLQHIQNDYVDEPNLEKVRSGALRGLAYGLDPYSAYLTAEQVKNFQETLSGSDLGIGAEFSQFSSYLYVVSVVKDSPAEKAGLKAGDIIEYIEQKATRDISLYDAKLLIEGPAGSEAKLRVLRTGAKPQTVVVKRASFALPAPTAEVKSGNVGVVKVYSLASGQAQLVRDRIKVLGERGVKKIVLDLRNVAGGDIDEGVSVANAFIKEGELAKVIGRENKPVKTYQAEAAQHIFDGDLAVLIDLGSAGASEVVASAVLERKRGEVVGEKSFGAGSSQQLFTLRGGDGLLLTTSKWAAPSGKAFMALKRSESGIKPSVEVKRPETPEPIEVEEMVEQQDDDNQDPQPTKPEEKKPNQKKSEDIQLKKAIEILLGKN